MRSRTGSAQILLHGIRHGSRGGMYVAGVSMLIAVVSILIKTSGY
nr:hypothetical protein [uncultured bacterium]